MILGDCFENFPCPDLADETCMDDEDWQPTLDCMGFETEEELGDYAVSIFLQNDPSLFESDPWQDGYEDGYEDGKDDAE